MFGEIAFVIVDGSYDDAVQGFSRVRGVVPGKREDVVSTTRPFAYGKERIGRCILWKQVEFCLFKRSTERRLAVDVIGAWLVSNVLRSMFWRRHYLDGLVEDMRF